ncbi:zona pellucida sperm-binding protein 3-like isoform X2 [Acanthochromis polyacanthus]|uniref:zona pellucida sperm-binding protein 3-like isoform X2 n=1 Tax=Acanthochromis polyacanthus TaxID=80966 RepID=UPI002234E3A3|nr:zona pellucida sperm-binding protein 3-like isoform X2 [Acanthochromis polyacanthus]
MSNCLQLSLQLIVLTWKASGDASWITRAVSSLKTAPAAGEKLTMQTAGRWVSLVLLISGALGAVEAIRTFKDGPMIDAEGREYKSAPFRVDDSFNDESTVRVWCTEVSMIVVVKADLYRNGRLVSPEELFLGESEPSDSRCRAAAAGSDEYVIEADLQACGSKLTMSEDSVIYSNLLTFSPLLGYHGITRTSQAAVPVSCHYKRTHVVSSSSSSAQQQPLTFYSSSKDSSGRFFSLKLMADDWTSELFSNTFYLGDLLHLEASYTGPGRRRLYVDSCVATLTPDQTSVPRYYFIEKNGCLMDSKEASSRTRFRPRLRTESLQLQLDVFLFEKHSRNSVFITCQLKATPELWTSSRINKACHYIRSRWENVDGDDAVCQCCDSSCSMRPSRDIMLCGSVTLGPLMISPRK